MKSVRKTAVCVSCGREPGLHYWHCPYCGEGVWQPLWRRVARAALLTVPPLLTGTMILLTRPDWRSAVQALRSAHPAIGFLFAAGVGLSLLPQADSDLVVSSHAERVRWQALAVGGTVLCGTYAAVTAACLCFGQAAATGAWLPGSAVIACVAAAPLFFRIPWRAPAAAAMLAAAIALGKRFAVLG